MAISPPRNPQPAPFRTPAPPPADATDPLPGWVAGGTPEPLRSELQRLLGADRVLHRASDLVRYASDASPYRLVPQVVVQPRDAREVAAVLGYARERGIPAVFRSGGTSLNGQAQSDGILIDTRRWFAKVQVLEDGAAVRVGPGALLGRANRALFKHARRVGPDPASTDVATFGGVIANNSGGMRCGTAQDSYSTLRSLTVVLPSGTTIDSAAPDADAQLAAAEPQLHAGLAAIRDEIRADAELSDRIRRKFAIKNTTGYRLCAFLDADTPAAILAKLLVGSEGTLAWIAEAVLDTVPHGRHTSTGMIFFPSIDAAAAPVRALVDAGATAVELMVNQSLIAAAWTLPGVPEAWRELPPTGAALLVELRSDDLAALDALDAATLAALSDHATLEAPRFTRDAHETETFWRVREGMQGVVGSLREQGTAMMIEDVCVPPERIAECVADLQALLGQHGFLTGVAGHASAGNLHFLLTPNLTDPADRDRYEQFMEGFVALAVDKYDGSLKAEHGTGRNMAPYVEREWGEHATGLMWRIKALCDPDGVLGPDVVLSRDPHVHLAHLKSTPPIEDVARANTCIECGFCEPVCPSRDVTFTPRQRIVLRREMARHEEGSPLREILRQEWEHDGQETCAADGSCVLACPVGIDTGKLVKSLRAAGLPEREARITRDAADRWGLVERAARAGLRAGGTAAKVVGDERITALTDRVRDRVGHDRLPRWSPAMPRAGTAHLPWTVREEAVAVYMPACINRMMGVSRLQPDGPLLVESLVMVSRRAGMPVWIPDDVAGTCCSTPWSSKGFADGQAAMASRLLDDLWRWSRQGALPVVIDASSCVHGVLGDAAAALPDDAARERLAQIEVLDAIAWAQRLLPSLPVTAPVPSVTLHPTCAQRHLGLVGAMEEIATAIAGEVVVPLDAGCCGMAGDRGLHHPELTASATRAEAAEVAARPTTAYASGNRTCELALQEATGKPYESIVQVLERATR